MVPVQTQVGLMGPATPQGYSASVMPVTGAQPMVQGLTAAPITANTTVAPVGGLPVQAQAVPQTGLIGSEAALNAGFSGATNAINSGTNSAISGLQSYMNSLGSPQPSVGGVTIIGGYSGGGGGSASPVEMGNINSSFDAANQAVAGYNQGQGAVKMQADLSGANGAAAQQAAYAAYQSSPALQYQMDQTQKAVERSAAAKGGLLSGRAGLELQRNAAGLASQDYQNQFANLGNVAQTGLTAAGQQAQIRAQQAGTEADLARQKMANENNLAVANMSGQYNIAGQSLAAQTDLQRQAMSIRGNIASQIADISSSTGLNLAGLHTQTANQLAQGRTNAGMAMAQNATQAASSISKLLNDQGVGVSDMMNKDISSITDFLYQSGIQDKVDMQNLAALIGNINSGQATNAMQGNQAIGAAQAAGQLGVGNAVNNAITQGIASGVLKV